MENPSTWKPAEVIIMQVLQSFKVAHAAGMVGPSLPHVIAEALRKAAIVSDQDQPEIGWEGLRAARGIASLDTPPPGPEPARSDPSAPESLL